MLIYYPYNNFHVATNCTLLFRFFVSVVIFFPPNPSYSDAYVSGHFRIILSKPATKG